MLILRILLEMWLWKKEVVFHFKVSECNDMSLFIVLSVRGPIYDNLSKFMQFVVGHVDDELVTGAGDCE